MKVFFNNNCPCFAEYNFFNVYCNNYSVLKHSVSNEQLSDYRVGMRGQVILVLISRDYGPTTICHNYRGNQAITTITTSKITDDLHLIIIIIQEK